MGRDKALLEIGGQTLLARAVALLKSAVPRVSIVGAPERYNQIGVPVFPDHLADCGPVSGVASALAEASAEWALMLACDMPHVGRDFLRFLRDRAASAAPEIQAVVPESSRGLEPLCAVYRANCAPIFESALAARKLKLTGVVVTLRLDRITESAWRPFSPEGTLFNSINHVEDYEAARRALEH